MPRWSLTPPLPGESTQEALSRLSNDLNLILAEQEQDALEIRAKEGYTAKFSGPLDLQGNTLKGLPHQPSVDSGAVSLRYLKSGRTLFSDGDTFQTDKRIQHGPAQNDQDSISLGQVQDLLKQMNFKDIPFVTALASSLLNQERILTGSSTITVTDSGANLPITLTIPTTVMDMGTHTPTLTNVANISASTAFTYGYIRILGGVICFGKVNVDPTTTAVLCQLGITIPVASDFSAIQHCGGVAFASNIASQGAAIVADLTNNRAQMQWMATDVTNQAMFFIFGYRIL